MTAVCSRRFLFASGQVFKVPVPSIEEPGNGQAAPSSALGWPRLQPTAVGAASNGEEVMRSAVKNNKHYTHKQGRYLAFIYYYTKVNGRAPSEADLQAYFRVTPPTVHAMILNLAAKGLVERSPGQPRSLRLLIAREDLPDLE